MDLKQLRYFQAIAEEGSISAASKHLKIAQPALSLHVRNMEDALGTRLLNRLPRGVALTEAGELLLHRARVVLQEVARIEDDIRNLGTSPAGDVRLGLPGTIGGILSVPLVLSAKSEVPGVRLTISEAMSGFILTWLREGVIDIAVLYGPAEEKQFRSDLLLSEELVLLAPPGMAMEEEIEPSLLRHVPLILPSPPHGLRTLLAGWARENDVRLTPEVELDSYANIIALVERGHGCSILPRHAVSEKAAGGLLKLARFATPGLRRDVYLVSNRSAGASHASDAVAQLVERTVADLVASGIWAGASQAPRETPSGG